MSKVKKYVYDNWLKWVANMAQLFLVAHISYYILKELTQVDLVESIWNKSERYYLSTYAALQVVVTYVFYKGIGFLVEWYLNRWIRKNEADLSIQLEKGDERELTKFIHSVFSILVWLNFISIEELDQLDEVGGTSEEHEKKWRKTIAIWKSAIGLLILGLTTAIITWDANLLFWILGIVLGSLIITSVFILLMYYVLLKNLHLINAFVKSYNSSTRLLKRSIANRKELP
ncbi:MAG: hypothetical protein HYZ14_15515 [Bacteroidetes bacterium]|nr:hypothetical protein [Bacteroidota bacterium]